MAFSKTYSFKVETKNMHAHTQFYAEKTVYLQKTTREDNVCCSSHVTRHTIGRAGTVKVNHEVLIHQVLYIDEK